jgi:hypothetical protein
MAPNLKHITLLSDSLLNLEVIRPKEALNQQSQTKKAKAVISENYWEWTSEAVPSAELFSADHMEANLVKDLDSKPSTVVTLQNASDSDNYWAEQVEDMEVESQPQHTQAESVSVPVSPVDSNHYWGWSNEQTESDNYWDTNPEVRQVERNQAVSNVYWQWSHAANENDAYWSEEMSVPAPSGNNYWNWSPSQETASDRYWAMPSAMAC